MIHLMTQVLAPCPGRLRAITEVDDPVFAQEMVGPGVAIDPDPGETTVVSPFVVLGDDGVGVLVHLGINTVRLEGKGFEVLAAQGDTVAVGTPMVRWDPSTITDEGMSSVVPVVAMDRPKGSVPDPSAETVVAGDLLFSVATSG